MVAVVEGVLNQTLNVDDIGHREYTVDYLVRVDNPGVDGAQVAYNAAGLPTVGSFYNVGNDLDTWAFCKWDTSVAKHIVSDGEPGELWKVTKKFSTKPFKLCNEITIENPLLQPPKISGTYTKLNREESFDRYGDMITNSAHELLRGPQVEFEHYDLSISIEMNVPLLQAALVSSLMNKVNSNIMWGFAPRRIKFSKFDFDEVYWGVCYKYYTWKLGFDIPTLGFDRFLLDEGTKVLWGYWDTVTGNYLIEEVPGVTGDPNPDPDNPQHFKRFTDRTGNKTNVILNGAGLPSGVYIDGAITVKVIPTTPLIFTGLEGFITVINQLNDPDDPVKVTVKITDPDDSLTLVGVRLEGTNGDRDISETITIIPAINPSNDLIYNSTNRYSTLVNVRVTGLFGDTGDEDIEVYANDKKSDIGYRYVEYYQEANLLQLGIPTVIGP